MRRSFVYLPTALLALLGPLACPSQAAEASITVTGAKLVDRGLIRVTGTITCFQNPAAAYSIAHISLDLAQRRNGPVVAQGGTTSGDCTGSPQAFTADMRAIDGIRLHKGRATLTVNNATRVFNCYAEIRDDEDFIDCQPAELAYNSPMTVPVR